jgi:hypothetical protein
MDKNLKNDLRAICDTIGKDKEGNITCRRGYFYRHGYTDTLFAEHICNVLNKHNIKYDLIEHNDIWKVFRGGASIANQSHFLVKFKIRGIK